MAKRHVSLSIQKPLVEMIKEYTEGPKRIYSSAADFTEDAIRRRLEYLHEQRCKIIPTKKCKGGK